MTWPILRVGKQREQLQRKEQELCDKYKAVFCNPMGAEVLFDITETLCRLHSTTGDDPSEVALKNLALIIRARIGLADEDYIRQELLNAPGA